MLIENSHQLQPSIQYPTIKLTISWCRWIHGPGRSCRHDHPMNCQACLPHERLFQGETDGSGFGRRLGAFGEYPSLPRFSPTSWNIIPNKSTFASWFYWPVISHYPWLSLAGSFPNGGLRVTHSAAAFTTWDRASPPFVLCRWENDLPLMEEIRQTHPLRLVVPSLSQYLGRVFFLKTSKRWLLLAGFLVAINSNSTTLTK